MLLGMKKLYKPMFYSKDKKTTLVAHGCCQESTTTKGIITQEEMEFLDGAQRSGTKKTYDNGWNIWVTWCQEHKIDFEEYHVQNVLKFLIDNQHYTVVTLAGAQKYKFAFFNVS
jgi:hypothetical protein